MYDAPMRWASVLRCAFASLLLCACGAGATEALLSDQLPPKQEAPDQAERYTLTGESTKVEVDINGVVSYTLTFSDIAGELLFSAETPEKSSANVRINMNSATTSNKELERIAKSEDFLDVEKYPTATFDVRSLTKSADANSYDMVAVLDLHGTEKALTVPFTLAVDPCQALGTTSFSIDRRKFGVESDTFLDGMAGDDIDIRVRIEISRDKAPPSCRAQRAQ
jgi:polyisoprenoid-binding protein YceI